MIKKGIILAGGMGTRMSPLTKAVNKQLLPLYDKPLIYYPLSILMLGGIRNILIIVNKGQLSQFKKILPEKNNLGLRLQYCEQNKPGGLPEAFIIGKNFIGRDNVSLILGDNFFYGQSLSKTLIKGTSLKKGARIFVHPVRNPNDYGVAKIDKKNKVIKLVEKPLKTISNYAVTGLYFFDNDVVKFSHKLKPSNFIATIESRQGFKIACLEEISLSKKWIGKKEIQKQINFYGRCDYSKYLERIIK